MGSRFTRRPLELPLELPLALWLFSAAGLASNLLHACLMKRRQLLHNASELTDARRELRRNATRAEAVLWACLRKSQLDGKKFRRQHSIGPYIVDFYCPECRVVVELDGEAHANPLAQERDAKRSEFLTRLGVTILRFDNDQVFKNRERVVEAIRASLKTSATEPPLA
mgnify:CR=1 FL=1